MDIFGALGAILGLSFFLIIGIAAYWEGIKRGARIIKGRRLKKMNIEPIHSTLWEKGNDILVLVLAMVIGIWFTCSGIWFAIVLLLAENVEEHPVYMRSLMPLLWLMMILFFIGSWTVSSAIATKEINPINKE